MSRRSIFLVLGSLILLGAAVGTYIVFKGAAKETSHEFPDKPILNRSVLASLPEKSASSADMTRLAEGIVPPTNSWISGAVLQEKPLAVFPMPLSFQASDTGFQIGLPEVTSSETAIIGGHTPGIEAEISGATSYQLTRFDKTSASLTYRQGTNNVGTITVTQGSPYVFYRAAKTSEIVITNAGGGAIKDDSYVYEKNGKKYALQGFNNASLKQDGATVTVTAQPDSLLTMYAIPSAGDDVLKEFAGNEITAVKVANEIKDSKAFTKFEYVTKNNKPTLFSALPYQTVDQGDITTPTYQSIYGDIKTYKANTFSTSVPLIEPDGELDLSKLSNDEKNQVKADLKKDTQELSIEAQDTYFAGKHLSRLATLLSLAEQLNDKEISAKVRSALKQELIKRLDGSYLYYDTELKGVAGQTAAFGSEDFNDHHFHYGYFIYAASILGKYDKEFVRDYKDRVNLLVADIASYETYEEFPVQRTYDPYSAHSWASGLSPFQDGNNQESSSEAIHAWNGVALWGEIIGNKTLQTTGRWMLSNETATADKAWRNVDTSASYLQAYTSPVASLSFGGKRTHSTFFNDESNAKLGIQLLPLSPVMKNFSSDGSAISSKLAAQDKPYDFNVTLGDYLLMYLALTDRTAAIDALAKQRDEFIDDGNSRAYIRAWIYSQN